MASSNKTTHLLLNQWAANDPVLRTDFNGDNARLDAAIYQRALLRLAGGTLTTAKSSISIALTDYELSQFRMLQLICAPLVAEGSYSGSYAGPMLQLSLNSGSKTNVLRVSSAQTAQGFEVRLILTSQGPLAYVVTGTGAATALNNLGSLNYNNPLTLNLSLSDSASFGVGTLYSVYGILA